VSDEQHPNSSDKREHGRSDIDGSQSTTSHPLSDGDHNHSSALGAILFELRSKPRLWAPFFVVGCLLTAVDYLREHDPLPIQPSGSESALQVSYTIFPTGTSETMRSLDAFVDLPLGVLAYAVSLELVVVGAVATAGWLTMKHTSDISFRLRQFFVYLAGLSLFYFLARLGSAVNLDYAPRTLLAGIIALAILSFIAVRLFLFPVAILHEKGIVTALRASWHRSKSHGAPLFGLIVILGLASGRIVQFPVVGAVLSSTIVGTLHAVALAVLYDWYDESTVNTTAKR